MEKTETEGLWGGVFGSPEKVFGCKGGESKPGAETEEQAGESDSNEDKRTPFAWDID